MFLELAGKLDALSLSGAVAHHSHADRRARNERLYRTWIYTYTLSRDIVHVLMYFCMHIHLLAILCTKSRLAFQRGCVYRYVSAIALVFDNARVITIIITRYITTADGHMIGTDLPRSMRCDNCTSLSVRRSMSQRPILIFIARLMGWKHF